MNLNNVTTGKAVPLGAIIIIITYLVSGASSTILPFVFLTGILVGIMKNEDMKEAAIAGLLSSLIGTVITTIISLAMMYIYYGSTYLMYILQSSILFIVLYIIVGSIGGVLGYFVYQEIK